MVKVRMMEPEITISDTSEKTVRITLTQDQVEDAIFTWLRLKGVKLPSQDMNRYTMNYNISNYITKKAQSNVQLIYIERF